MFIEVEYFVVFLDNIIIEYLGNVVFYKGILNGYFIVVVKIGKGLENIVVVIVIGIERYYFCFIIN